jgi:ATP-dependent helicase/DNAse subunit B
MSANGQERLLAERGWDSFDEIVAHWRSALPALGDAFADGCAAVDPVDAQQACKYCDLQTLCRISTRIDSDEGPGMEGGGDD